MGLKNRWTSPDMNRVRSGESDMNNRIKLPSDKVG